MTNPASNLPRISVALCTYNGARHLAAQLDSLDGQTHRPCEIVICDDGSSDGTPAVVAAFRARSTIAVRFEVNAHQLGYRANFLKAARRCAGDLVAFCDQDDLWLPAKLARCARAFDDPSVMLVAHEALICDAEGTASAVRMYEASHGATVAAFRGARPLVPWPNIQGFTEVFRRGLLAVAGVDAITDHFTGDTLAHDQVVVAAALDRGRIVFIDEPLAYYRQHGFNVVGYRRCNLKAAIHRLLVNRAARLLPFARAAQDRAAFHGRARACDEPTGPFAAPAIAAAYARLAKLYALRADLYAESSWRRRRAVWNELLAERAYGPGDGWNLSVRSRREDFWLGLWLHFFLIEPNTAKALTHRLKALAPRAP